MTHVMMWVDPDRARQILLNLVTNAIKYASASGGQITLSFVGTPQSVSIHVADNGPGNPGEKLAANLRTLCSAGDRSHQRRGGVGLGLTISRTLARAMKVI